MHKILTKAKTVQYSTVKYSELYSAVLYSFLLGKNSMCTKPVLSVSQVHGLKKKIETRWTGILTYEFISFVSKQVITSVTENRFSSNIRRVNGTKKI